MFHIRITHHFDPNPVLERRLDWLIRALLKLDKQEGKIMQVVEDLIAEVAAEKDLVASAKKVIDKFVDLVQNGLDLNDIGRVQAAVNDMRGNAAALAAAVAAGTGALPATEPASTPDPEPEVPAPEGQPA